LSILVVGSVALDTVKTPFGQVIDVLGGSASYFSTAASYFSDINLVAVVGEDFPDEHVELMKGRNIDLTGLQRMPGKTFRWVGEYGYDLNEARTHSTCLNVFESFRPHIPDNYKDSPYVFLANIDPELQLDVLKQVNDPELVALDTMNFWIEGKAEALRETLRHVNVLIINEAEARQLTQEYHLLHAARALLSWGPWALVIKRGSYGALLFTSESIFSAPAYIMDKVFDPTGAGDSFAGGFMGYLENTHNTTEASIRQAIIFGSVMASFNCENFSVQRLSNLTYQEIEQRFREFRQLTHFDDLTGSIRR